MSKSEEYNPKQQPPYIDPALVIDTRLRQIEREQTEEKKQQQEYNRKQLRFNGLLVLFTALLFLTSIGSDLLMLRYVNLTKQSADAATSAANTASMALAQSKIDSASQDKRNSEAQKASAAQSKAALDESISASRNDQRGWAIIGNERIANEATTGSPLTVVVDISNSGKTPILDVTIKYGIGLTPEPEAAHWTTIPAAAHGVIFPNAVSSGISLETREKVTDPA